VPFPNLFDDFIFETYFHLLCVQTREASQLDVPAVIGVTPGSGFARKGVCVLAVDVEEVVSDRLLGQSVIGNRFLHLVGAVLRGGRSSSWGACSVMPTVAWILFLTELDLSVRVIPKSAMRLPRNS
jgi:hypothetical protein